MLSTMLPKRRSVLQSLPFLPLGALAADTRTPKVTVSGLEIFRVHVNRRGDWVIARLRTNAGLTGIGDGSQSGNDESMIRFMHQFFEAMKGRSVYDLEYLCGIGMKEAERSRLPEPVALSALEQCLWDIRGRVVGQPVHQLLGGPLQQRIRLYANINRSTQPRTPDGFAAMASRAVAVGFDAVK